MTKPEPFDAADYLNSPEAELAYLRETLIEWRDARQAIFDTQTSMGVTPQQFARLSVAEHLLMGLARKIND